MFVSSHICKTSDISFSSIFLIIHLPHLYFRLSALQRYLFTHSLSLIKNSFFRIDKSRKIRNLYAFPAPELSPAPPEADAQLRLLLNCLYMISERHYPCAQLKAIYELRALTLAGYMPDVLACAGCGKYDGGEFYLDPVEGRLLCADCAEKARHITNLDNGALYALRHICLAEDKKLFGFKISPESLQELSRTSEQYTLAHLEHGLKSLDFLKSVLE